MTSGLELIRVQLVTAIFNASQREIVDIERVTECTVTSDAGTEFDGHQKHTTAIVSLSIRKGGDLERRLVTLAGSESSIARDILSTQHAEMGVGVRVGEPRSADRV